MALKKSVPAPSFPPSNTSRYVPETAEPPVSLPAVLSFSFFRRIFSSGSHACDLRFCFMQPGSNAGKPCFLTKTLIFCLDQ